MFFLILKLKCLRPFVSQGKKLEVTETFFFKNVDFEYFSSMTLSFIVIVFGNSLIQGCQTNKRKMLIICFRISTQKNPLWSRKWLWTRDWSYWVCSLKQSGRGKMNKPIVNHWGICTMAFSYYDGRNSSSFSLLVQLKAIVMKAFFKVIKLRSKKKNKINSGSSRVKKVYRSSTVLQFCKLLGEDFRAK